MTEGSRPHARGGGISTWEEVAHTLARQLRQVPGCEVHREQPDVTGCPPCKAHEALRIYQAKVTDQNHRANRRRK